jgi:hypothetical protein
MMKTRSNTTLDALNQAMEDESFRKKFQSIFQVGEKLTFSLVEKPESEVRDSCSCWAYLCGVGCFGGPMGPPGSMVG